MFFDTMFLYNLLGANTQRNVFVFVEKQISLMTFIAKKLMLNKALWVAFKLPTVFSWLSERRMSVCKKRR